MTQKNSPDLQAIKDASVSNLRSTHKQDENENNWLDWLSYLLSVKWVLLLALLVGLAIGFYKNFTTVPIYQAFSLIQLETRPGNNIAAALLPGAEAAITLPSEGLETEIVVLLSYYTLSEVVQQLGLDLVAKPLYYRYIGIDFARNFRGEGFAKPLFDLEQLNSYAWGGEKIEVTAFNIPLDYIGQLFTLVATEENAYDLFLNGEKILSGYTGQMRQVDYHGQSFELLVEALAARPGTHFIIRRIEPIQAVNELAKQLSIFEYRRNSRVLEININHPDPQMAKEIVNTVAETYLRQNQNLRALAAQKSLDFIQEQIPTLRENLNQAQEAVDEFHSKNGMIVLTQSTEQSLQQLITLEGKIRDLELKHSELRNVLATEHPRMKVINEQIRYFKSELTDLEKVIKVLPEQEKRFLLLTREAEVARALYANFANKAQEISIAKAGAIANVRILQSALEATGPINIKTVKNYVLFSMMSLALVVVLLIGWRLMFGQINDPEKIESRFGVPVYASIPHSKAEEKVHRDANQKKTSAQPYLLAVRNPTDQALEGFKSLRTFLHFTVFTAQNNILLITGPKPGLGKTFVSSNLAWVLADLGKKVILMDTDLRRGRVQQVFNLSKKQPGIVDYLVGKVNLDQVLVAFPENPKLFVIPTGEKQPNSMGLLTSSKFHAALQCLSQQCDVLILDSAPLLGLADTFAVGQSVGATLMVLKENCHSYAEIDHVIAQLEKFQVPFSGVVFNGMTLGGGLYYRKNYYQHYSNAYNYKSS